MVLNFANAVSFRDGGFGTNVRGDLPSQHGESIIPEWELNIIEQMEELGLKMIEMIHQSRIGIEYD